MAKITKRTLDAMRPGKLVWDSEIKGFGARCQRQAKTFVIKYRYNGRQRWYTIGQYGSPWTVDNARARAKAVLGSVAEGKDPAAIRDNLRNRPTIIELCDRFLEEHAYEHKKASSIRSDEMNIRNHIKPFMGRMHVAEITRADVDALKLAVKTGKTATGVVTGGQTVANRCLALFSKMMNLAEQWGLRPEGTNPCRHVTKYKENPRERFLSEAEISRLSDVLTKMEAIETPYVIGAIRLLLMTGARLTEILGAKWDYVDFERAVLSLPDSKTGSKEIFLPAPALEVLSKLPRLEANPFVIAGHREGAHLVNLQKPWRRIRKAAELEDVRIHDLRHSFASAAAASGMSLPMIGRLLGHQQAQTTQRYAHLANDPVKAAANVVGERIAAAMKGNGAKVMNFGKRHI